jgi:phage shock protein A
MNLQLDIFDEQEIFLLKQEMKKTKDTSENVRKGIFARFHALEKNLMTKYQEQQQKIEHLESLLNSR